MEANYTVHWKREICCYWKHLQSSGIKLNIKWAWCMHTPHGDFSFGCADVLAVRRSPGSWILSWPWPQLCVLKRAQHSRYSRNERSRFFLLTAPSSAKSSHTTWLQKYCSHRHCCLCKLHKTLLPLPSQEVYWCSRMFAWETCALLSSVLLLCYLNSLLEMSW